jgi:hypothetical protein
VLGALQNCLSNSFSANKCFDRKLPEVSRAEIDESRNRKRLSIRQYLCAALSRVARAY